jgi:hypothetical protein
LNTCFQSLGVIESGFNGTVDFTQLGRIKIDSV